MAQQSNDRVARTLIDPSGREVLWPSVFLGVKNVVKANNLNNDTLTCIKGWLKSNDSQMHVPLLALTVLHTLSLNCTTLVRNQIAAPRLFQRLEKTLAKPQGPQVVTALLQILVDWTYLFGQEELGQRSHALLDQPRHRQMSAGYTPSPAVLAMQEEMQLGVPAVAPIRGEDFLRWMYRGAAPAPIMSVTAAPALAGPSLISPAGGSGGVPDVVPTTVQSGALPGGAPPLITPPAVPELCTRMQADAGRLTSALSSCRAAARVGRQSDLTAAMDAAYREAERCSQWRRRVQDYTQSSDEPPGLYAVLAATDDINSALQAWQQFTGQEVYELMRITVSPMPPELRRPRKSAPAGGQPPPASRPVQLQEDLLQLFGIGPPGPTNGNGSTNLLGNLLGNSGSSARSQPSNVQLPTPTGNPFALGVSVGNGASGASTSAASRPTETSIGSAGWDPFATPAPAPAPRPVAQPASSSFATVPTIVGVSQQNSGGLAPGPSWPRGANSEPFSPNMSSRLPSSGLLSPSNASATSGTSETRPAHASSPLGQLANGHPYGTTGMGAPAVSSELSRRSTSNGSVTVPPLNWQPEYDKLASELQSLCAAPVNGTAAAGRGVDVASLLPNMLARVKSMCEALAAQHARQVAALASASAAPYSPHPPSPSETPAAHHVRGGPGGPSKLREVASTSAIAGAGASAGDAGHGNGVAEAAPPGGIGGSWLGFVAGGARPPAVGPLQQHLMQQQQQQQPLQQYHSPYPPPAPQEQQPPRPNGVPVNPIVAVDRDPVSLI